MVFPDKVQQKKPSYLWMFYISRSPMYVEITDKSMSMDFWVIFNMGL